MKIVALYGGSFNPSTKAHRDIGLEVLKSLPVDEVWYLVTPQNPDKPRAGMAAFHHRVRMAELNTQDCPGLIVKDIEEKYAQETGAGVIETADTLRRLTHDFPDHRFMWVMGADNFSSFHTWKDPRYMAENFPIVLAPRPGHTQSALESVTADYSPHIENADDLRTTNGWYLLDMPLSPIAARDCVPELIQGRAPEALRPVVADYALRIVKYATLTSTS